MLVSENNIASVSFIRAELMAMLPKYTRIRDCVDGEDRVKAKGEIYLPKPHVAQDDIANDFRYNAYKKRATFYNATKRTAKGLHGQIFMREPKTLLPPEMEYLHTDANGSGVGLVQLAKRACLENLSLGRGGFLVDYPDTGGGASMLDIEEGRVRPYIYFYTAEQIINWRTEVMGASRVVTLLVLQEKFDRTDTPESFEVKTGVMWRVLTLDGGVYRSQVITAPFEGNPTRQISSQVMPTDASGKVFDRIPFYFVGSENNDADIDDPPLDDIATLNIAHYRNSADYEDSCFFCGQPTPVITGLKQAWVEQNMAEGMLIGSRTTWLLPENADAKFLQAQPNSMPFEAMQHKERQMVALGAKLVEQPGVVRTASEAEITFTSENSVLSNVALNVASAIRGALAVAARFAGVPSTEIVFQLNTDFDIAHMSPEKLRQIVEAWQRGAISFTELRDSLSKASLASLPDREAALQIQREMTQRQPQQNNSSSTQGTGQ